MSTGAWQHMHFKLSIWMLVYLQVQDQLSSEQELAGYHSDLHVPQAAAFFGFVVFMISMLCSLFGKCHMRVSIAKL